MQLINRYKNPITDNQQVTLWEGSFNNYGGSITLNDNIYNYSQLIFTFVNGTEFMSVPIPVLKNENKLSGCGVLDYRYQNINITQMSETSNVIRIDGALWIDKSNNGGARFTKVIGIKKM